VGFRFAIILAILLPLSSALASESAGEKNPSRVDAAFEARSAFFLRSDLPSTLKFTELGLESNPDDAELLFLKMESSALRANDVDTLDAAVKLCSVQQARPDARGSIAAARILDLSGNTPAFRRILPTVEHLLGENSPFSKSLRGAVVAAGSDGVPGISLLQAAHAAGLITNWRIAGPFGKYSNVDFDRLWAPERDLLQGESSGSLPVEQVQYPDGGLLLPDYFARVGVFYAAAKFDLEGGADRVLRVESPGTLQVFVDGKSALQKDERFQIGKELAAATLHLSAGSHTILLKFVPKALPIRVSILTPEPTRPLIELRTSPDQAGALEAAYINASLSFWRGEQTDAAASLLALKRQHDFAALDFLLAQLWAETGDGSPEFSAYLTSTLQLAPTAAAAEFLLAQEAYDNDRTDEAWQRLSRVTAAEPDFAPAQHLVFQIAEERNWTADAISAIQAELMNHPGCDVIRRAHHFYAAHQQFAKANSLQTESENCVPGSTVYAELLSEAGRHAEAAKIAAKLVKSDPLSRRKRMLLVKEMALGGNTDAAHLAAVELSQLAPNSLQFQQMAAASDIVAAVLEEDGDRQRGKDFGSADAFYSPYRKDGAAFVKETAAKQYSGVPAVLLLKETVTQLGADGSLSAYIHRIVRVVTRDGVAKYGEVSLPNNADVLELRTIRPDGNVAEPEFSQHKNTISMPALSPGAVIDEEYVVRYPRSDLNSAADYLSFHFASFDCPILQSRFVALTPQSVQVAAVSLAGAPAAKSEQDHGLRVQVWEQHDVAQYPHESSLPKREILPTVKLYQLSGSGWSEIRDYYRDLLIDAVRIGPRVRATVTNLNLEQLPDSAKLAAIDNYVNFQVRDDSQGWDDGTIASAEDTLAIGEGDRTATAIALARAAGLNADLVLARDVSADVPAISASALNHPLMLVQMGSALKLLDLQTTGIALGAVSPRLDMQQDLVVPVTAGEAGCSDCLLPLPASSTVEQSTATGDLRMSASGDLDANVTITLGPWRAAQMRTSLLGVESDERAQFFNQMAGRLFSGATNVSWDVRNERRLDAPLQIVLACHVPHFLKVEVGQVTMDQLVPTLGLRQMYITGSSRHFPLYIDAPLVERTTYRVTLPTNIRVARRIDSVNLRNSFGSYSLTAKEIGGGTFEVTRQFDIPVQVVSPGRYADFAGFANAIDRVERNRFKLAVLNSGTNSAGQ
jgi:tetratricopeptide (TPR) repeat protein